MIERDYLLDPCEFSIRAPMIFYLCPENNLPKTDDEYAQATDPGGHGPLSTLFSLCTPKQVSPFTSTAMQASDR